MLFWIGVVTGIPLTLLFQALWKEIHWTEFRWNRPPRTRLKTGRRKW